MLKMSLLKNDMIKDMQLEIDQLKKNNKTLKDALALCLESSTKENCQCNTILSKLQAGQ